MPSMTFAVPLDGFEFEGMKFSAGHGKVIWDENDNIMVEKFERMFDELTQDKSHQAYYVGEDAKKSGRMEAFDPAAEAMILKPIAGG